MPFQAGILEACQDWGFVLGRNGAMGILPYAGWKTRGNINFNPRGSVNHHTAGAKLGLLPSLNVLLYGRADVKGPLCNAALARNACLHLLAAGRANHAGKGGWKGLVGNSSVWGLEVEHVGTTIESVTDEQWEAMYRWHRACADYSGFHVGYVCQHFEWAPNRKIDFVKGLTNPGAFRANVQSVLEGEGDMPLNDADKQWITNTVERSVRDNVARLGQYLAGGQGNQVFNPALEGREWMDEALTNPALRVAMAGYFAKNSAGVEYILLPNHTAKIAPGALQDWARALWTLSNLDTTPVSVPDEVLAAVPDV